MTARYSKVHLNRFKKKEATQQGNYTSAYRYTRDRIEYIDYRE